MALNQPIDGKITITSRFGLRGSVPGLKTNTTNHLGTDLRAAVGTLALAPADGVVYAYRQAGRYYGPRIFTAALAGNWILTWHPALGIYVTYAHLQTVTVTLGQTVRAGQMVGRTGNSGGVAAHIHVGVWTRIGNTWTAHDPEQYFEFVPKTSAPDTTPTAPLEEDDMYTTEDRDRDDKAASLTGFTNAAVGRIENHVVQLRAELNRVAIDAGLARWASVEGRSALAAVQNALAELPDTTLATVELDDKAVDKVIAEVAQRLQPVAAVPATE